LCVKKNKSQYMGALGYPAARGIVRIGLGKWREIGCGGLLL